MLRRTPFPSRSYREADPRAKALPTGSPREHAAHLLDKLEALYPFSEYALLKDVRNAPGVQHEVVRYADALAVRLCGAVWDTEGFELKLSRSDWLRELRDPAKSGPLKAFCGRWWLVVPAPWKNIVHHLGELPDRWGLIEVGTGDPVVVVEAARREAEEPTPGFGMMLIRAARARGQGVGAKEIGGVPLRGITRIWDRDHVGLDCGHLALSPLRKGPLHPVPCGSCAMGLPPDEEIVAAAIKAAGAEEIKRLRALTSARMAELGVETVCTCPKRGQDALACLYLQLVALGLREDDARSAARKTPCHCACHPREAGAS